MLKYTLSFILFLLIGCNNDTPKNNETKNSTTSKTSNTNNRTTTHATTNNKTSNTNNTTNNKTTSTNNGTTTNGTTTNNGSTNNPNASLGSPCIFDSDCGPTEFDVCSNEADYGFPGGYCISFGCADPGAEKYPNGVTYQNDEDCGEGNVCQIWLSGGRRVTGSCWAGCNRHSDCREGYECYAGGGLNEDDSYPLLCFRSAGCSSDRDCGGYHCAKEANDGAGICTFDCGFENSKGVDYCVASGGACVDVGGLYEACILPE